ncbi:hypothetical protein AMK34_09445 [Amycolatopsis sp. CB00013]|nr:hypothetical protein AMK34_09445 [Amycolatopsis sp. CB00013]
MYAAKCAVTSNTTTARPVTTAGRNNERRCPVPVSSTTAGRRSSGKASSKAGTSSDAHTASDQKAARQPKALPTNVPNGTPSTEAAATPPTVKETASALSRAATSLMATAEAIPQTAPMPTPSTIRAIMSSPKSTVIAVSPFPMASTATAAASTRRRSRSPSSRGTTGAVTAETRPVTVRLSPVAPAEMPRPSAIGVSIPTGSISAVTTRNVLRVSTPTAAHRDRTGSG